MYPGSANIIFAPHRKDREMLLILKSPGIAAMIRGHFP
jgi:hypothetical protein